MTLKWIADLPTTNLRILVTLCVFVATALTYLALAFLTRVFALDFKAWVPSESWLAFIAVMAGLDWGQFHSKRKTEFPAKKKPTPPPTAP
jgi:hypothetical protein